MDRAALQKRIDSFVWYHEFDFGDGLKAVSKTPDAGSHRYIWNTIQQRLDRIDFAGKSVLDIGCWDGYWSFYAERRGAASVLATDDASQNWATGEGLRLAHGLLKSSVEINQNMSVYDLASLNRRFDVVLCLGVYYHLIDPFYAFAQIRHCCHENTLVVLEGDATQSIRTDTFYFDFGNRSSTCFLPPPRGLQEMLEAAYFTVESRDVTIGAREPPASKWRRFKMAWRAWKAFGEELPRTPLPLGSPLHCRMITTCRPFAGESTLHRYKPPFGLHRYDPRFSGSA